jgi:hypothetical protein
MGERYGAAERLPSTVDSRERQRVKEARCDISSAWWNWTTFFSIRPGDRWWLPVPGQSLLAWPPIGYEGPPDLTYQVHTVIDTFLSIVMAG